MIYSYTEFIDIILFINSNNRWNKRMDKKEGLEIGKGNPFTTESSVSYRKAYKAMQAEPYYETTTYD